LQVEFILVLFSPALVLCSPVCEYAEQRHLMLLKERDNTVIEQVCRGQCMFAGIELRKGYM